MRDKVHISQNLRDKVYFFVYCIIDILLKFVYYLHGKVPNDTKHTTDDLIFDRRQNFNINESGRTST